MINMMDSSDKKAQIKLSKKVNLQKLLCVKSLKMLTGLGLRESKDIADVLTNYRYDEILITNYDQESIDNLINSGVDINFYCDREDNLDEILTIFSILFIDNHRLVYKIRKGSFEFKGDVVEVNIEEGVKILDKENIIDKRSEISSMKLTISMNSCFIEEYI